MRSFLCLSLLLFSFSNIHSVEIPPLTRQVTDEAGILSTEMVRQLELKLKQNESETSNQIAVLILSSLEGEIIEDLAVKVFESWKLGQDKKDNGVLLLIAIKDRKMRIEVGYGLEGVLTDQLASRIVKQEIRPRFKAGEMDEGVEAGVNAIIAATKGEYQPSEDDVVTSHKESRRDPLIFAFVFLGIGLSVPGIIGYIFLLLGVLPLKLALETLIPFPFWIVPFLLVLIILVVIKIMFRKSSGGSGFGGGFYDSGSSWSSGGDSWSSGGGDSWSGGGGDSGGGGASGDW
ncbi:TPM domain-containing protein [Leptospira ryugenii]|nr:TPM domain-containing protein [Leptospira ryugenii]